MIRTNELMIGDWVRNDLGEIQRIDEIRQDDVMLSYNDYYSYDEIDPVPLTPEILEKNGWVHYEDDKDSFHGEDCVFLKQKKGGYGVCIDKVRTISGMIYYVHELQHALHFCEIDKEIKI